MNRTVCKLIVAALSAALTGAATAGEVRPAPPYINPHLADSTYAVAHPQGVSANVGGPTAPSHVLRSDEWTYRGAGPGNSFVGMYSAPYPDGHRAFWVGGHDRVTKVDAETLEVLATYSLGDRVYFNESEIERHLATMDKLSGKPLVEYSLNVWLQPWEAASTFYRLLNDKNEFYLPYRAKDGTIAIRVYGDENPKDRYSRIVLKREWKIPPSLSRATLCGMNLANDGTLLLSTMDGTLIALSGDFSNYTTLKLPAKAEENRSKSAKASKESAMKEDLLDAFVRNGFNVDDRNGIYIASRDYLYRVQWTGSKLSLDEADGGWKQTYPNGSGRGTGTTPALMGWGPNEDHLVIFADGEKSNNAMAFWRDQIPADWQGLPGFDRRVAGVTPVRFGVSKNEPMQLEASPAVFGYGAMFIQCYTSDGDNTKTMVDVTSPSQKWLAQSAVFGVPGYGARGGAKIEWDPKTRKLNTAWQTQNNFACVVPMISRVNDVVYSLGSDDYQWMIVGTDWHTGKATYRYTLGNSNRFNPMGAIVNLAPDGAVMCSGCGMGLLRVKPHERLDKK